MFMTLHISDSWFGIFNVNIIMPCHNHLWIITYTRFESFQYGEYWYHLVPVYGFDASNNQRESDASLLLDFL